MYVEIGAVPLRKQAERKKQILIKWDFSIVWQNFNLLGRFEFHKQQSVINIDEMISENRMAATENNRRSADLKIPALLFRCVEQK
jgi:hypothetical protein